ACLPNHASILRKVNAALCLGSESNTRYGQKTIATRGREPVMSAFPQTIHFIGSNTPRRVELSARNLDVEGEIPAEIDGAFFRAVPDNAHAPMFDDDIALNHDGMIARFNVEKGAVDFDIKYVHTDRYLAERKARKALF